MAAHAPLWVLSAVFVLLGFLTTADPKSAREFFARLIKRIYGSRAQERYESITLGVFRIVGIGLILVGLMVVIGVNG